MWVSEGGGVCEEGRGVKEGYEEKEMRKGRYEAWWSGGEGRWVRKERCGIRGEG